MTHTRAIAIAVLILCVPTFIAACDFLGDEERQERDELLPLAVGNYWAYSTSRLGGAVADSFTVEISREVRVTYEGEQFTVFAESVRRNAFPPPEHEWLLGNGEEGLYTMGGIAETDTLVLRSLTRKYPAHVGETWTDIRFAYRQSSTREFEVQDTIAISLHAKAEPFETPLGTFRCHVYKYSFRPADDVLSHWNVYTYYSPGVGLVGEIIKSQAPGRPEEPEIMQETLLYEYRVQ